MALVIQRPQTDSYRLAYAYDPAFDTSRPDYERVYARCAERLDFNEIIRPGETPTWFWFAPLSVSQVRRLIDVSSGSRHFWLAFRMALRRIEGLDEVERATDAEWAKLGELVKVDLCDSLEEVPRRLGRPPFELINDLGAQVLARAMGPSPK